MKLTIKKQEVFGEVEKRSSIEGYALPERFDNVWADSSRGEVLDSFWIEGYTSIVQLLKRYLSQASVNYDLSKYNGDEVLTIDAEMPERYNALLDGSIQTDVKMMLACNILHGWLEVVSPESAAKYDEEANGYAEDIRVKLLYRNAPTQALVVIKGDDDQMEDKTEEFAAHKTDDVSICGCDFGMEYPEEDDVPMVQMWERTCRVK